MGCETHYFGLEGVNSDFPTRFSSQGDRVGWTSGQGEGASKDLGEIVDQG